MDGSQLGRNAATVSTIVQTAITILLSLTGYLMQSKLSDVTEELRAIATNLRTIEERNYKLSERSALIELRVEELEKRVSRYLTREQIHALGQEKRPTP